MKFTAIIFFPFLILTCGIIEFLFPVQFPQRYMDRDVEPKELVGTWQVTSDSQSRIDIYLQQQDEFWPISPAPWNSIILNDNGSCKIELESSWAVDNEVLNEADALPTCTWKIDRLLGYDEQGSSNYVTGLFVRFEHYNEQEDRYYVYYSESFIAEEDNKLVIWNFIGNPSQIRYQNFERTNR